MTEREYTDRDLAYWVITAMEGGIGYWCDKAEPVERGDDGQFYEMIGDSYTQWQIDGVGAYANPLFWENGKRGYRLWDEYEQAWIPEVLTMTSIQKALQFKPKKVKGQNPHWFRKVVDRLLSEDYDAEDADTLVQVAVFRELVYG